MQDAQQSLHISLCKRSSTASTETVLLERRRSLVGHLLVAECLDLPEAKDMLWALEQVAAGTQAPCSTLLGLCA